MHNKNNWPTLRKYKRVYEGDLHCLLLRQWSEATMLTWATVLSKEYAMLDGTRLMVFPILMTSKELRGVTHTCGANMKMKATNSSKANAWYSVCRYVMTNTCALIGARGKRAAYEPPGNEASCTVWASGHSQSPSTRWEEDMWYHSAKISCYTIHIVFSALAAVCPSLLHATWTMCTTTLISVWGRLAQSQVSFTSSYM